MSVVTGVMLICELSGRDDEPSDEVAQIQAWLRQREPHPRTWELKEIADHAGGSKHPQFEAWCGGFNHFREVENDFVEFVLTREWEQRENLVLILQPEEGETRVIRPANY